MIKKLALWILFLFFSQPIFAQLRIDWQNCFIGPDLDKVNDVLQLDDGYFILGSFGIHVNNPLIIRQSDVWLIRTDINGNLLWDKKFGGSKDDFGKKILKTQDDNFIIIAQSSSTDKDVTNNPYPESSNYWVLKINSTGNILWSKVVGGYGTDLSENATITNDGGIIITGRSQSNDGDVSVSYGSWDNWLVKLDSLGNKTWDYSIGTESVEFGQEIFQKEDGEILIGGSSSHYGNGNIYCDFYNELFGESVLTKFDANLTLEWQQCYGGSSHELLSCITVFQDGYIASHTASSNDGDLYQSGFHGFCDIWLTKIDSSGNLIWGKCYGGSDYDEGTRIFENSQNGIIVFGTTDSDDGDIQGVHSQGKDIWVFTIDSIGNLSWQQCLGGNGEESISLGVKQISYNSYVVAASTFGSFGTGDIGCHTTADTSDDIWFFKVTDTTVVSRNENKFSKLKVFPNPAQDYIIFESDEKINGFFTLYNLLGERIINDNSFKNDSVINVINVPSGIYLFTLTDKEGNYSAGKLIIN